MWCYQQESSTFWKTHKQETGTKESMNWNTVASFWKSSFWLYYFVHISIIHWCSFIFSFLAPKCRGAAIENMINTFLKCKPSHNEFIAFGWLIAKILHSANIAQLPLKQQGVNAVASIFCWCFESHGLQFRKSRSLENFAFNQPNFSLKEVRFCVTIHSANN